jgi:hypothetical protein
MKCQITLCVSVTLAWMQVLNAGEPTIELGEAERAALLASANAWGVPQPKAGSSLVKIWVFKSGDGDRYALGFREAQDAKRALVGFDYVDIENRMEVKEVSDPGKVSLEDVSSTSPFSGVNGVNFGLVTGLQLLRAGNAGVGTELIRKSFKEEAGHHRSAFRSPAGEAPAAMLARSCLADAMNQISSEQPDFAVIKRRIEAILKDQPQLKGEATDWAITGLEASVQYKPAPQGSIDSLVDAYLLSGGSEGAMSARHGEFGEAERALILRGFEAVPALLKQRGSKRFTNHVMQGFNNFPSYPMDAGQVVNAYMQRLANDVFGSNWLDRQKGYTSEDDAVLAWWEKASEMGEKAYVSAHTIHVDNGGEVSLSSELLTIAEARYADLLPGFYQRILKTSASSWPIAEAYVKSDAPLEQKLELLNKAIATNHQQHRNGALRLLRDLSEVTADGQLLRILKSAPRTAKEEYWIDQDARLGGLVSNSTDKDVWNAFHGLLDRADLGMQMELIDHLKPAKDAPAGILESFHLIYDRFRNDTRMRDESTSEKFSGPGAGFPHRKISMRDYVYTHWGRWLGLKLTSPEKGASPQQWEEYRAAVSGAVDQARTTN